MSENTVYLKENVYFEPLFNQWYAWPYLIPPATGSRHVVNTHLRIMKSFINNYQLHILANKEKALTGGEFLDASEEQVSTIKKLIEETKDTCADLIELSDAIVQLDELVREHKSGKSVDYLYEKVPYALKGYVEIFLDLEHRASYRFIEPLLYDSRFYKPELQTVQFGLLSKVDERPFVLSTPRIPDENHLQLKVDYNHGFIDKLSRAREMPIHLDEIEKIFTSVGLEGGLNYQELFTSSKPSKVHSPVSKGVRLAYTGHAGFLVESSDVAIMIDPFIANRGQSNADEIISYSELPSKLNYILLTHNHQDHVSLETLLQLRYKTEKVIVPKNNGGTLPDPSIRLLLKQFGFNVEEVDDLDVIDIPKGHIKSVPFFGEHGDLNIRSKAAWYIELEGKKMFFGADSSNPDTNLFKHMSRYFFDLDVLAIGMECVGAPYTWLYGALHTKMVPKVIKESRRLNGSDAKQAFEIIKEFGTKQVYLYALGMEPWYKYFMGIDYDDDSEQIRQTNKLKEMCAELDVPVDTLFGKKIIQLG